MSAFTGLAKVGPKSQMRLQTLYQNTPPFNTQYLLIIRLGSKYKIQVKLQPLWEPFLGKGNFSLGLDQRFFLLSFQLNRDVPEVSPEIQYGFSVTDTNFTILHPRQYRVFIQLECCKCRWEDNTFLRVTKTCAVHFSSEGRRLHSLQLPRKCRCTYRL